MYISDEDFGITQEYVDELIENLCSVRHCLGYYASKQKQASEELSPAFISLKRNGKTNQTELDLHLANGVKGISKSAKFARVLKNKEVALAALLFCDSYVAALCESTGASYEDFSISLRQTLDAVRHSQSIAKDKHYSAKCHCECDNKEQGGQEQNFMNEMLEKDYPFFHFPCYNESCEKDYEDMVTNEDADKSYVHKCFEQELREQQECADEYADEEKTIDELRRECGEYGYSKEKPYGRHRHHHRHHHRR